MTERLYYDDPYLWEFDGRAVQTREEKDQIWIALDRSAFYPTSGGQPYDTGTMAWDGGEARVLDVEVDREGVVWHRTDRRIPEGAAVRGRIDGDRRRDHMEQHGGEHMLAGAIWEKLGGTTIGLHLGKEDSSIDVSMPEGRTHLSEEEIRMLEETVNDRIRRDAPIRCWFPTKEELAELPLRKAPTVQEHIRIVAMGDFEMVACGGTHPSSAGQIGLVKILSVAPARGKMRVAFLAGQRAIMDYFKCYEAAHAAAAVISCSVNHLSSCVSAIQEKLRTAEYELVNLKKEHLLSQLQSFVDEAEILPNGTKLIARFVEADAMLLRELVSELIKQTGMIVLMGARNGDQAIYVFGRSSDVKVDIGTLLRYSACPLGGKGGGRPDFAQGGGSVEILSAACQALKNCEKPT